MAIDPVCGFLLDYERVVLLVELGFLRGMSDRGSDRDDPSRHGDAAAG
jgi:hypothetical protein